MQNILKCGNWVLEFQGMQFPKKIGIPIAICVPDVFSLFLLRSQYIRWPFGHSRSAVVKVLVGLDAIDEFWCSRVFFFCIDREFSTDLKTVPLKEWEFTKCVRIALPSYDALSPLDRCPVSEVISYFVSIQSQSHRSDWYWQWKASQSLSLGAISSLSAKA